MAGSAGAAATSAEAGPPESGRGTAPPGDRVRPGDGVRHGEGVRLDIQGLRGLAVLLVVLYHTDTTISGGYIGVDVFFVLSGFVITGLLTREVRRDGVIDLPGFFARRVRRILPLLAVTLSVTAVAGVVLLSPLGASATTAKTAIAGSLFNANTFLQRQADDYFGLAPEANALLHIWSLSVEEQFYLCVPLVVWAVLAVRRRVTTVGRAGRGAALALVGLAGLASYALYARLLSGTSAGLVAKVGASGQAIAFYSAPTRAWEFLAGAALALVAVRLPTLPRPARQVSGLLGLVLVVGSGLVYTSADARSATAMLVPVLGTVLVLAAGATPAARPGSASPVPSPSVLSASVLSVRPMTWIGDRSYGWYLFHWPLIVFAAANFAASWMQAVAAVVALGLAAIAKHTIEDPWRRRRHLSRRRVVVLAAVCIGTPLLVGGLALVASRALRIDELDAAGARHVDSELCNRRQAPAVAIDDPACTWAVDQPKGRIVLLGDSHASMWSEAVIEAGNDLGYDVSIATMSGCPTIGGDVIRMRDGAPDTECREFMDRSLAELTELRPDVVLLASATQSLVHVAGSGAEWTAPDGTVWTADDDRLPDMLGEGLKDAVGRLTAAGVPTAVLHDVPYHTFTNAGCSWLRFQLSPTGCASTRSRSVVDAELETSRLAETRATEGTELASTIDPVPWLCTRSRCSTYGDGTWWYRDGDHLSVQGSTVLGARMEAQLRALGLGQGS